MIPARNVVAWGVVVPWSDQRQVEQDLIIGRALVEIFSDDMLRDAVRVRGGTALNKLHFPKTSSARLDGLAEPRDHPRLAQPGHEGGRLPVAELWDLIVGPQPAHGTAPLFRRRLLFQAMRRVSSSSSASSCSGVLCGEGNVALGLQTRAGIARAVAAPMRSGAAAISRSQTCV